MSTENQSNAPAKVATIALTQSMLAAPASLSEMIQLPAVQQRWIKTYESVSGRNDGENRFAAEMILFTQACDKLKDCDRFTIYGAFIELAISGLTLRDGLTYIVGFGKKAQFMVGWKGRLEQMLEIPKIIHVSEPQVVYDCDIFDYEKGLELKIHSHRPASPRPEEAQIEHVYMVVHFTHGKEIYMMDRADVLAIRDTYSKSYKAYIKALHNDKNKGKAVGDVLQGTAKGQNGFYDYDIEPPMWISSEAQAFKKTLVKRTWNNQQKLPKHAILDDNYNKFIANNPDAGGFDPDENTHRIAEQSKAVTEALNAVNILAEDEEVDTDTGEITKSEDVTNATPELTEKQKKAAAKKAEQKAAPVAEKQPETNQSNNEVDTTEGW